MEKLTDIKYIREVMQRHGTNFSKALGQNFLINPSVCPRIAEMGGAAPGTGIIEIGAGVGVLTRELALRADKVVTVEIDARLLPVLDETLADFGNIRVVNADIMKTDLHELIRTEFDGLSVSVCANLPYYITSPVIMRLLEERLPIDTVTVMVQKEAARRLCAADGTRECGAVTYAVRYFSEPEVLFDVSRGSFMPAPNVDSSVIRFNIRKGPPAVTDEKLMFRIIRGAFSKRRKTAANAISSSADIPKADIIAAMEECGLSAGARPEQLTLGDYAALTEKLKGRSV